MVRFVTTWTAVHCDVHIFLIGVSNRVDLAMSVRINAEISKQ